MMYVFRECPCFWKKHNEVFKCEGLCVLAERETERERDRDRKTREIKKMERWEQLRQGFNKW